MPHWGDLIPGAGGTSSGVTAVTASGNIASSGGATPNITFTGILAIANGGTGMATPGLVPGTNVTITGTWPNQTINATTLVDDANLVLSQKAYGQRTQPTVATAVATPIVVDDASLQLAVRTLQFHQQASIAPTVATTLAVDDASLTLSQRSYQFHQQAPQVVAFATDVLQTQVFGA